MLMLMVAGFWAAAAVAVGTLIAAYGFSRCRFGLLAAGSAVIVVVALPLAEAWTERLPTSGAALFADEIVSTAPDDVGDHIVIARPHD